MSILSAHEGAVAPCIGPATQQVLDKWQNTLQLGLFHRLKVVVKLHCS
jgi:hypothetical protein